MTQEIGTKIRNLRESAGIVPGELAQRANISVEQLDRIERSQVTPTMAVMSRVARVLGVRLGTLLDGEEHAGPVVCRHRNEAQTVRVTGREADPKGHLNFFALAEGKKDRHMEPLIVDVANAASDVAPMSHHEGEEFLYVLSGKVRIEYATEVYELGVGDSIYYDSIVPHHVSAVEGESARVLAVLYTPM
ncbi:MAG: XRE family transcriptional regulator [Rikenellaceae bacterium]|jgi:transcriptional regulator with XRE-family HTH domain|nr:XRE family transcriptional regulator [Rikenellaceae bacterium]